MARIGRSYAARPTYSHAVFSNRLDEDFDTSDQASIVTATGLDLKWGVVQSTIAVLSNRASGTATGPARARAEHLLDSFDMWVEAVGTNTLEDVANQNVNLALRVSAGDNSQIDMYVCQFQFQANNVRFQRTVDGTSTLISTSSTVALVAGTDYTFRFEVTGDINNAALVAKVDGTTVHTFTDTGAVAAGFQPDLFAGFALQEPSTGESRLNQWSAGTIFVGVSNAPPAIGRVHVRAPVLATGVRSAVGRTHLRGTARGFQVAPPSVGRIHARGTSRGFLKAPPALGRVHIRARGQQTGVRSAVGRIHGRATSQAHPNSAATGRIHPRALAVGGAPSTTPSAAGIGRFHFRGTATAHPNVAGSGRVHVRARALAVPASRAVGRTHVRAKAQALVRAQALARFHLRARSLAHPNISGKGWIHVRGTGLFIPFGAATPVRFPGFADPQGVGVEAASQGNHYALRNGTKIDAEPVGVGVGATRQGKGVEAEEAP